MITATTRVAPEKAVFRPALSLHLYAGPLPEKMMSQYSEKLRDPRWQKRRLQILERDLWSCQMCFDTSSTLMVHHRYYTKGCEPWDYPGCALVTLCEICHEDEHQDARQIERDLVEILRASGAFNSQLSELHGVFCRLALTLSSPQWDILCHQMRRLVDGLKNADQYDAWLKEYSEWCKSLPSFDKYLEEKGE